MCQVATITRLITNFQAYQDSSEDYSMFENTYLTLKLFSSLSTCLYIEIFF
jgi:hypothetical protein